MDKLSDILGREFKCLDGGFVRLVDVMGDDAAIVQAARVSYGQGTKTISEDRGLIRHLMRHRHTSPFEMVEFKFHVKLPIFVARQWIRHRTANVNEYSGRYSEMKDEFYVPDPAQIRLQSLSNRQGRSDEALTDSKASEIVEMFSASQQKLYEEYSSVLQAGVAREIARINLPLSSYTEWYWKIDLHNLFNFLRLRLDADAQWEIRVYAERIEEIVKPIVPLAYEAFEDYSLKSITFSANELKIIKDLIAENLSDDTDFTKYNIKGGEIREFKEKISKIVMSYEL